MSYYIADEVPDLLRKLEPEKLIVRPLAEQGALLDCGYTLFQQIFDVSVLDPKSVYDDRMSSEAFLCRDFYPCFAVAFFEHAHDIIVAGFASSDLMWILNDPLRSILAIGNIATSPSLKSLGLRGVGSRLVETVTQSALSACKQDGRKLSYSVAEAEPASLGFWKKAGFRWPQGCRYLQPPLEFDDEGKPLYEEVAETILFAPNEAPKDAIDSATVSKVIETIFENWCLRGWRDSLSEEAIQQAEEYVMGRVLERISSSMPVGSLPLVDELPPAERS